MHFITLVHLKIRVLFQLCRDSRRRTIILLSVANTTNKVSGAKVKSVLPLYVDWVGAVVLQVSLLTMILLRVRLFGILEMWKLVQVQRFSKTGLF